MQGVSNTKCGNCGEVKERLVKLTSDVVKGSKLASKTVTATKTVKVPYCLFFTKEVEVSQDVYVSMNIDYESTHDLIVCSSCLSKGLKSLPKKKV